MNDSSSFRQTPVAVAKILKVVSAPLGSQLTDDERVMYSVTLNADTAAELASLSGQAEATKEVAGAPAAIVVGYHVDMDEEGNALGSAPDFTDSAALNILETYAQDMQMGHKWISLAGNSEASEAVSKASRFEADVKAAGVLMVGYNEDITIEVGEPNSYDSERIHFIDPIYF